MKPKVTFNTCIQCPDRGRVCKAVGNIANKPKGSPNANPNAVKPISGLMKSESSVTILMRLPMKGSVQENETSTRVKAMKKIPISPPRSVIDSDLLIHDEGSLISNTPKNDNPNKKNITKNMILKNHPVESSFSF